MSRFAQISAQTKAAIRQAWANGDKQATIAEHFGVSLSVVSRIVAGIKKGQKADVVSRRCIDCGMPLDRKMRCAKCKAIWRKQYNQKYYAARRKTE